MEVLMWPSVVHLLTWYRKKTGARYAAKAYSCLDPSVQKAVVEDMKKYEEDLGVEKVETDVLKNLKRFVVGSPVFRSVFYIRCRGSYQRSPRLRRITEACKFFLPPDPRMEISTNNIGEGLHIYHASVSIGAPVVIGKNVTIGPNVIIGKRHRRCPVIHDNVSISAGAIILGGIEIGEGAIIGAGAVVLSSVPANEVYVGNPARFLHEKTGRERMELLEKN